MQININVPIRLLIQIQRTIKQFADDYHDLHKAELEFIRQPKVDTKELKSYYQSDRKLFTEQERERIEEAVRQRGV